MKYKTLFILNSDFGVLNTIGARAEHIAKEFDSMSNLYILCRDYDKNLKNKFNFIKVVPIGKFVMQVLTAIPIYITKKIPSNKIKIKIFEYFLLNRLKKMDLSDVRIIHSWDFLPNTYKFIKTNYPNIKIIQDVPMATANILHTLNKPELEFIGEKLVPQKELLDSLEYIDKFIVPSNFVLDSLVDMKISKKYISVIPFGVDVSKFKPIKKLDNIFRVAFSGNVNNRKGIKYLIKAWKELNLKNAELNLYGRVYPEVLKYFKDKEKFNINVCGFVDIKKELPKNDLYVFPSLMEGSSKSVYEAMACEMPVITTYNAGSVVCDGIDGFIVPVQDSEFLKKMILFLYNDRNKLIDFGRSARKNVNNFTWDVYGKKIVNEYGKLK
jgi:glycosyltransferase involved in cell wall biosynthesis